MSYQLQVLRCEHFSVSNAVSARCYQCGDLWPTSQSTGNIAFNVKGSIIWES